ncbi:MAG: 3-oxoacyl-[acyl-carrier-protein] reductase FabG [Naasia sp.]|nr:3-oxoacyl-[acyl-carrier-protein] reductase FabG [Naasia sp.]
MQLPAFLDLSGRTALVTGAGSAEGIGFASARALGRLGATVAITSTTGRIADRVAELAAEGIQAHGFVARLETEEGVAALVADLAAAGLELDILVNNAGMIAVSDPEGMASGDITLSAADWHRGIAMNLSSAFLVTAAVVPGMRRRGWGRIVNMSSDSGPVTALRGDIVYSAAKAGMVGLTKALAVDEAEHGITANAIAPGWIATASQLETEAQEGDLVPAGRSGTADEIATAVAWLASPGAGYITGQVLVIDGGASVTSERRPGVFGADVVARRRAEREQNGVVTPADLSRELGVDQETIRDHLRQQHGTLPEDVTRWRLTPEQVEDVRRRFAKREG